MDILKDTESELNRILQQNQDEINQLINKFNYSDEDLNKLKKDIEKDFNISIETPETVVLGKASKEVFDKIYNDLSNTIIGQDEACRAFTTAFRRPYVVGSDPQKIRNSIILYGSNGTGRYQMVTTMGQLLKQYGLAVSNEVFVLNMARYQSSSQEILFLQDLYVALSGRNPIVLIENFEEASPIFNRMLNELVLEGSCVLGKRYTLKNNQLVEATNTLSGDIIDHLSGNDKVLVFVSEKNPTKLMDIFGKSFVDKIDDKVQTKKLDEESLVKIIEQLVESLITRCQSQLEMNLTVDHSINDYLKSIYEPNDGADSITPTVSKIYNEMVDVALKYDDITDATLRYDETVKVSFNEQSLDLEVIDDSRAEREEIQKELDDIVGLDFVKNYLLSLENLLKINQIRKQKGLKTNEISKHMIFTGNPGTGKTTIARIVSRMMKACGILKQGQLVEVTRADLVGKYVGHTAPLTMSVIQSALGGVLFIDEAYSLYRGKDDSFGLEAIDTLVKAMEDHRDDLIVILAGYTKEMQEFLEANSGLKSRFANIIEFDDYTGEELMLIAKSIAKGKDYVIAEDALRPLQDYFTIIQNQGDPNSGNGRLARNLVEDAILNQSKRLLEHPDDEKMNVLERVDFNLGERNK
ncbi:MAG: AAA family ATPase [Erysipelotrichaceae bacterium]|nr:AAA family ATPase [Erysipelotrichaceae bacterium]MBR5754625.1 AAA family ATPase [Erysipelotrichaceae bacterium]